MSNPATKIHLLVWPSDKSYRCGRTVGRSNVASTDDKAKATCGQCVTPNTAISYQGNSPYRG